MNKLPWTKQAWTIAKIEMRRAFFSKRAFWVYGLALFPTVIFMGHFASVKFQRVRLSSGAPIAAVLLDSVREGETDAEIMQRLGNPASDSSWQSRQRVRDETDPSGITTHNIEQGIEARYIRLNIMRPTYSNDAAARIYEFEVYGDADTNLALNRPVKGSRACSDREEPEKAFNGNVQDNWCSREWSKFLQVDLGEIVPVRRIVIKHSSAAGKPENLNTAMFNLQASNDDRIFETIVNATGSRMVEEIISYRVLEYFDGKRRATLRFTDGKLASINIHSLLNFEEDRSIFAGVFQHFYLRLAIFFGCLGIFMNLSYNLQLI